MEEKSDDNAPPYLLKSKDEDSPMEDVKEDDLVRDDTDTFLEVAPSTVSPSLSPPAKSLPGLSLGRLGELGGRRNEEEKDTSEQGECVRNAEAEVMIIFELPDGSQTEQKFKMGQSVEVLKSFVASEVGMPMDQQQLYVEDKLMFDPLSLMDFPEIVSGRDDDVYIRVEGEMESEARK